MVEFFFVSSCLLDAVFFGMGFGPILEPKFLEESYAFILSLDFFAFYSDWHSFKRSAATRGGFVIHKPPLKRNPTVRSLC